MLHSLSGSLSGTIGALLLPLARVELEGGARGAAFLLLLYGCLLTLGDHTLGALHLPLPGPLPALGDDALGALLLSLSLSLETLPSVLCSSFFLILLVLPLAHEELEDSARCAALFLLNLPGSLPALSDDALGAQILSLPDPLGGALSALLLPLAHGYFFPIYLLNAGLGRSCSGLGRTCTGLGSSCTVLAGIAQLW